MNVARNAEESTELRVLSTIRGAWVSDELATGNLLPSVGMWGRWSAILIAPLAFGALACDGALPEDACNLENPIQQVQQPTQYICSNRNPDVQTDPNSPDFGVASCAVIEGHWVFRDPDFCTCKGEGFTRLIPSAYSFAIKEAQQSGQCGDECCAKLCFCERQQLMGDALHACQQEGVRGGPTGWCYVAPDRGIGTLDALEPLYPWEKYCPNPEAILYSGDYLDGIRFVSCWR